VHRVARDQLADTLRHLPTVTSDVADEVSGDPVIKPGRVALPAAVP
jgi:hypothetical protein